MSAPTITKRIQLNLETREAFLLNSIYAVGLRTVAGDAPKARDDLVKAVKTILHGQHALDSLLALSTKMKHCALSITADDNQQMVVDP